MFSQVKLYIYGIVLTTIAVLGSLLAYNRRENKILRKVVETQEEALEVEHTIDKVTNLIHVEKLVEEASIELSIKETKGKVANADIDNTELDPEFIQLLNTHTDKIRSKAASSRTHRS